MANGKASAMRPFETRYWVDARKSHPITRGFPKAEDGSIKGAAKIIAQGMASKVQCIDRHSGRVLWTVKRAPKVPGVNIRGVIPYRGDPDA